MEVIPVVVAVICLDHKSLIVERGDDTDPDCDCPDHDEAHGKWEFPGGKLEVGETLEKAVLREVREELGPRAKVKVERLVHAQVNVYGSGTPYLVLYYQCCPVDHIKFMVKPGILHAWVRDAAMLKAGGYDYLPGTMEVLRLQGGSGYERTD